MRVINVSLSELETKVLMIGFEGENQITQVRIDAAEILTDHPNATPTLIAKPLFGFAYPVIVTKEGTDVVWEIDNSVLSFHGDGEIQLTFTEGTVIAKSYVGRIRIKRSLEVNGEKPDPIETWEQAATAKLAEVDAQIDELEDMVEAAEAAKDQAQDIVDDAAADIQAAGATQIAAVEAKGEEVRESIPSDYTELSDDVTGLKSAIRSLGDRISDLEYVEIVINSLSVSPSLAEIGTTVTSATLTYAMNRDATQMKLDGNAIQNTDKTGTISMSSLSLTSNKTWTLQATDERLSQESEWVSKTATLTFTNKVLYGVASIPDSLNDTFLNELATRTLSTGKIRSFNVNAGSGQYIWYALPSSYGTCTFTVGGFTGGFSLVATQNHTNESGSTIEYRIYRSDNANLGSVSVSVS